MQNTSIVVAASVAFTGLALTASASYADTVPLVLDANLPGVVQPLVVNGLGNVFSFDNSVSGFNPVATSSQTSTQPGSTVVKTKTTYNYSQTFEKAQTSTELSNYINGLNQQKLANIQTGSAAGGTSTTTTLGARTTGPVITLTNLGSASQNFSETVYFHSQQYNTSLVGGAPGQGGTGVIATTLTQGVEGTANPTSTTTGIPTTTTTPGAFSTPTVTTITTGGGHGTTKYVYTWTRTVTTTVTTPFTTTELFENTIQNMPATTAAFSNLNFSLLAKPGVWTSAPAVNNAQGSFDAADFTNTIFSTNAVFGAPGSPTVQYLMLPNLGSPALPTLYPIAHADEYAFVISGTLAPYSTGQLQLSVSSVPEPSTWALLTLGFAGLGLAGYRSAKKGALQTA